MSINIPRMGTIVYVHPEVWQSASDPLPQVAFAAEVIEDNHPAFQAFMYRCESHKAAVLLIGEWRAKLAKNGPFPFVQHKA